MVWGRAQEFAFQSSYSGDMQAAGPVTTFCHYFLTAWGKIKKKIQEPKFFHSNFPFE